MIHNRSTIKVLTAALVVIIGCLVLSRVGLSFLGDFVEQVLYGLLSTGKQLAAMAVETGGVALVLFVAGNFALTCLIFLSTKFYGFLRGRRKRARIVIAGSTLMVGLAIMVVQAGFCIGFPPNVISEVLTDISKMLFGLEGLLLSYAPLYYSMQADKSQPIHVDNKYSDQGLNRR